MLLVDGLDNDGNILGGGGGKGEGRCVAVRDKGNKGKKGGGGEEGKGVLGYLLFSMI